MKPSALMHLLQEAYQNFKSEDERPRRPGGEDNPEEAWRMLQASEKRSHFVLGSIVVLLAVCLAKIGYLQLVESSDIEANGQQFYRYAVTRNLPAKRGQILDREGNVLANSELCHTVWAVPEKLSASPRARALSAMLAAKAARLCSVARNWFSSVRRARLVLRSSISLMSERMRFWLSMMR